MNKLQPKINSSEIGTELYGYFTYNSETDEVCFASSEWSDFYDDFRDEKCPIKWEDYEEVPLAEFNITKIKFAQFLIRHWLNDSAPNFHLNDVIEYLNQLETLNKQIKGVFFPLKVGSGHDKGFMKILKHDGLYSELHNKEEVIQYLENIITQIRENEKNC